MIRLTFGTFLCSIFNSKKNGKGKSATLASLLAVMEDGVDYVHRTEYIRKFLKGIQNLPDTDKFKGKSHDEIIKCLRSELNGYFDTDGQKLFIAMMKSIIKSDTFIDETALVGFQEGYTKHDICQGQRFDFMELLANVLWFCAFDVSNRIARNEDEKITDNFIAECKKDSKSIVLIEDKLTILTPFISKTVDDYTAMLAFTEIKTSKMALLNPNSLSIYCLDIKNSKFDYTQLEEAIKNNITNYIYGRARRNRYDTTKYNSLVIDALRKYEKRIKDDPTTNHFDELMLYLFLEGFLKAPKIYSKMELQDKSGEYESLASGIHVLTIEKNGEVCTQLVFGAADTEADIYAAMDKTMSQVGQVLKASRDELTFINTQILDETFDFETNRILEELILPKKDNTRAPDTSFGIFVGYTVNAPKGCSNKEFIRLVKEQLRRDIDNLAEYEKAQIAKYGLENYSFYIYLLPLNDAATDKIKIMQEAL